MQRTVVGLAMNNELERGSLSRSITEFVWTCGIIRKTLRYGILCHGRD